MQAPYTIQSMLSVQHSLNRTMAAEVGYLRTDGKDFPLQRQFTQAIRRADRCEAESITWARRAATTSTAARRWYTTGCRRRCGSVSRTGTPGMSTTPSARARRRRAATSRRTTSRRSRTIRTSGIPNSTADRRAMTSGIGSTCRSSTSLPPVGDRERHERRARRLADFRHRPDAIG